MNRETSIQSSDTLVVVDRSRRNRQLIIIAAVILALVAIGAFVAMKRSASQKQAAATAGKTAGQIPSVTVVVPGRTQVARIVTASGPLGAKRDQPVGIAGAGGRVIRVRDVIQTESG